MADPGPGSPPSLRGITFRRSIHVGRVYLVAGIAPMIFYGAVFSFAGGDAFTTAYPLLAPVFSVVGGMGGMVLFTADRQKGVLEYLLAYGVSPERLFENVLLASLAQTTLVTGTSLALGLGFFVASGHSVTPLLVRLLVGYALPMGYACTAFAVMLGMYWTALSSPSMGSTSPIGLVPLVGIAPSIGTLVASLAAPALATVILGLVLATMTAIVLGLLLAVGRLLPRERLLSPS